MEQLSIPQMNSEPETTNKTRIASFCYAILLTVLAYLLWTSMFQQNTLLFWISAAVLFTATLIFGLVLGAKPNPVNCVLYLCGVVYAMHAWINGLYFASLYVYAHAIVLTYALFVLSLFGNHNRALRTGTFILDAIKAVFIYPFIRFVTYFTSLFHWKERSKRIGKTVLFVLIGVAAALILGLIAIALLSFDSRFAALVKIDFQLEDVPEAFLKLLLSVPAAAILFSAFRSSREKKLDAFSTPEKADAIGSRVKKIPSVVFLIPAITLLAIYGLFFFSQWDIYTGAFSGVLPEAYTAAEYARSGFFELCAVAAINAALCTSFTVFARKSNSAWTVVKKIVNTLFAIATLILIVTALSKLALYIQRFDLTYTRFFVAILLFLFTVGFITLILSQWIRRVRVMPVLVVCVALLLLAAPFCNVRGRIAKYNVDRYLDRAAQSETDNRIDLWYLTDDLGDAAIPEAIRLLESGKLSEEDANWLRETMQKNYHALKEYDTSCHTLASLRALNALNVFFGEPKQ